MIANILNQAKELEEFYNSYSIPKELDEVFYCALSSYSKDIELSIHVAHREFVFPLIADVFGPHDWVAYSVGDNIHWKRKFSENLTVTLECVGKREPICKAVEPSDFPLQLTCNQ